MKYMSLLVTLVAGLGMVGCGGDVCEDAGDIIAECTGADSDGEADGEEAECTGDAEAFANCVVDNEDAVCDGLADPTDSDNAYNACVADVAGS